MLHGTAFALNTEECDHKLGCQIQTQEPRTRMLNNRRVFLQIQLAAYTNKASGLHSDAVC